MNQDIWYTILHNIENFRDVLLARRICKESNNGFFLHFQKKSNVYPKRTFIIQNRCMCCDKITERHNTIRYEENHPPRLLYFCDSFDCFVQCLNKYLKDMNTSSTYPFFSYSKKVIIVKRSNGKYSLGKITRTPLVVIHEKLYCNVIFEENNETVPIIKKEYNFVLQKNVPISEQISVTPHKMFLPMWKDTIIDCINTL